MRMRLAADPHVRARYNAYSTKSLGIQIKSDEKQTDQPVKMVFMLRLARSLKSEGIQVSTSHT